MDNSPERINPPAPTWLERVALALLPGTAAAWLLFAFEIYSGRGTPSLAFVSGWGIAVCALHFLTLTFGARVIHSAPARIGLYSAAVLGIAHAWRLSTDWSPGETAWLAGATLGLAAGLSCAWETFRRRGQAAFSEALRWIGLGTAAVLLLLPYYWDGGIGAGDAAWYLIMMADFVSQLREGIFPVWVGQTPYAFNGAVIPLRVAPLFQHEAGLIDLLTFRTLDWLPLRNLTISLNGAAIIASSYLCIRSILSRHPNAAAVLAALFLASPSVLASVYFGDQFMQFVAMPFIPVVLLGVWQGWKDDSLGAELIVAGGLAAMWWAHSPVALWTSIFAAGSLVARLLFRRSRRGATLRIAAGAGLFLLLGSYPFVSALTLDNVNPTILQGESVLPSLGEAFPRNLLPIAVSLAAGSQGTYQPGYAALAIPSLALLFRSRRRERNAGIFLAGVCLLPFLLFPIPGVASLLWRSAPSTLVTITNVWPMQRLMSLWTAFMLFSGAVIFAQALPGTGRRTRLMFAGCLATLAAWSAREASLLAAYAGRTMMPAREARTILQPNNILLTRYAYTSFERIPDYFSHGFMEPLWESRLLRADLSGVLASNAEGATAGPPIQEGRFIANIGNQSPATHFLLTPALTLQPGQRYALELDFLVPEGPGYIQAIGGDLFREYILPNSGAGITIDSESLSFGNGPQNFQIVPLQTLAQEPLQLSLQYITLSGPSPGGFAVADFRLHPYQTEDLPVRIRGMAPYRASVQTVVPAWLETPRIWSSRFKAVVNGNESEVRRSSQNLAMIPLNPGNNEISLTYRPPLPVVASYGVAVAGWLFALAMLGYRAFRGSVRSDEAAPARPDRASADPGCAR
jgi:hypothetical protein